MADHFIGVGTQNGAKRLVDTGELSGASEVVAEMVVGGVMRKAFTASIASSATTSGTIDLGAYVLSAVDLPAAFTGTALSFQGSHDGVIFDPIHKDGALYSVACGTSRNLSLDLMAMLAYRYIRLVSGSAEGAARTFTAIGVLG